MAPKLHCIKSTIIILHPRHVAKFVWDFLYIYHATPITTFDNSPYRQSNIYLKGRDSECFGLLL